MSFAGTDLQKALSLANADSLFKVHYKDYHEEVFNTATPFWGQVEKTNDFTGKRLEFPVPIGYQGGVGSGRIPEANRRPLGDCVVTSKKMYATSRVDRESIMASLDDKGAFVKILNEAAKSTTQSDVWNHSRAAFNDGTGSLGTIDTNGVTDNGGGDYDIVISAASWKVANWEEGMFVNIGTGTDLFEITEVVESTRTISLQRQAGGTTVPAQADVVYMQGSKDNDIHGLKVLLETSGTHYGIAIQRRWKAYQVLNYGAAISPQLFNRVMLGVEKQSGKAPTACFTSYTQFEKLMNQLEDKKHYSVTEVKNLKGTMGFKGIQYMGPQGVMNIFPDKFCEDDYAYFLNMKYIKYYRRPNSGFVKEDIGGNGYLRVVGEDEFEARMATYGDLFIALPYHGVVTGLTV